eukprot:m.12487 g.12487  ORF g.12487 m.12487 type:complete len:946 (+) comp3237_c0_seq1:137-2974(+)
MSQVPLYATQTVDLDELVTSAEDVTFEVDDDDNGIPRSRRSSHHTRLSFAAMPLATSEAKPAAQLYDEETLNRIIAERKLVMSTGQIVDFVLVYKLPSDVGSEYELNMMAKQHIHPNSKTKTALKRLAFERHLQRDRGLVVEKELSTDHQTIFVKIHAPLEALQLQAEISRIKMPLNTEPVAQPPVRLTLADKVIRRLPKLLQRLLRVQTIMEGESVVPAAPFVYDKRHTFKNFDDELGFFTLSQRQLLVWHMLLRTKYAANKVSIERLLDNGSYEAAFPLHDSLVNPDKLELVGTRTRLYEQWGRFRALFKPQPFQMIRSYFGEKIGIYFVFLSFYTLSLIIPAILGVIVILVGLINFGDNPVIDQVCSSDLVICAPCDGCEKWQLSDSCDSLKWSFVFDNNGSIAFGFLMAVWASLFLDFWKRQNAELAFHWDLLDFEDLEPQRAGFRPIVSRRYNEQKKRQEKYYPTKENPITGRKERYYPSWLRKLKYLGSFSVLVFMLSLVAVVVIATVVYRLAVRASLYESDSVSRDDATLVTSLTAALLNLVGILVLEFLYRFVAVFLNDWENHKTQSKYELHLSIKMYLFYFANSYSSLFYIAFFKGRFVGYPGNYNNFFGYRHDECSSSGCYLELTIQLFVIMVGKQSWNNVVEILLPRIESWWTRFRASGKHHHATPWEKEFFSLAEWPAPPLGLFEDYLEMLMQFGFITLFVPAFPLAPLFALLNNIFEIRVDSSKLVLAYRRPVAFRAGGIGVWQKLLEFVSVVSVITNGLVLSLTSDFILRLMYRRNNDGSLDGFIETVYPASTVDASVDPDQANCNYFGLRDADGRTSFYYEVALARLAFFVAFEHCVFFLKFVIQAMIPNVPRYISEYHKREAYEARMKINDLQDVDNDDPSDYDEEDEPYEDDEEASSSQPAEQRQFFTPPTTAQVSRDPSLHRSVSSV